MAANRRTFLSSSSKALSISYTPILVSPPHCVWFPCILFLHRVLHFIPTYALSSSALSFALNSYRIIGKWGFCHFAGNHLNSLALLIILWPEWFSGQMHRADSFDFHLRPGWILLGEKTDICTWLKKSLLLMYRLCGYLLGSDYVMGGSIICPKLGSIQFNLLLLFILINFFLCTIFFGCCCFT